MSDRFYFPKYQKDCVNLIGTLTIRRLYYVVQFTTMQFEAGF